MNWTHKCSTVPVQPCTFAHAGQLHHHLAVVNGMLALQMGSLGVLSGDALESPERGGGGGPAGGLE